MTLWLTEKSVTFGEEILKPNIYKLINRNKRVHRTSKVDSILAEHGHTVLQSPPRHPELNLTEIIWATVRNWVAETLKIVTS
jgi:hypothetical protein